MTAVEFIEQQYNYNGKLTPVDFYQAKEMEKQQMIDAYISNDTTEYESLQEACNRACNFSQQDKP
jgi:hypothetical protein